MKIEDLPEIIPWLRTAIDNDLAAARAGNDDPDAIADCEAKLAILEAWDAEFRNMDGRTVPADSTLVGLSVAISLLAWGYHHRPGWKADWRP